MALVWSLRVAERMNTSAAMYAWPVQLGWQGFRDREPDPVPAVVPAAVVEEPAHAAAAIRFGRLDRRAHGRTRPSDELSDPAASTRR